MHKKPVILYVDDEPLNRQIFQVLFRNKYDIITAADGDSGLIFLDNYPDTLIVISDMRMPKMTGIEFINKAKVKYPDKEYYILTGFDITPEIQEALKNGLINKYFSKPINVKEIETAMSSVFRA